MKQLRIGVNALYMIPGGVGGTEIYLRNLLRALSQMDQRHYWYIFTNAETSSDLVPLSGNFIQVRQGIRAANRPIRLLWEQTGLPFHAWRLGLDCLLNPGFTAPAFPPCPQVTVFHDLQHKRHPEFFRWYDLPAWRLFLWIAARRSRMVLAISEATRTDVMLYYRLPADRIVLAPLGVEEEFFSISEWRMTDEPLLLCVSTLHPHKNIERLLRVFARFRTAHPKWALVLTGIRGFRAKQVEELVTALGLSDSVRITGWIPRSELYDLFRRARAFVYPSMFEGFGLPVLEAMAAGVPLACSDIEPIRSIVGNTAVRFDPQSEDQMLAALETITQPGINVEEAQNRARAFTWGHCAEQTLGAIEKAVARSGRRG